MGQDYPKLSGLKTPMLTIAPFICFAYSTPDICCLPGRQELLLWLALLK